MEWNSVTTSCVSVHRIVGKERQRLVENSLSKRPFLEQRERILWRTRRSPAMSTLGVEQHSQFGEQLAIEPLPNANAIFGHFRLGQVRFIYLLVRKILKIRLISTLFHGEFAYPILYSLLFLHEPWIVVYIWYQLDGYKIIDLSFYRAFLIWKQRLIFNFIRW